MGRIITKHIFKILVLWKTYGINNFTPFFLSYAPAVSITWIITAVRQKVPPPISPTEKECLFGRMSKEDT